MDQHEIDDSEWKVSLLGEEINNYDNLLDMLRDLVDDYDVPTYH